MILFQKGRVANLEGLLAQGSPNVDERYILKSESDELLEALKQSVNGEMERHRREQSMSYMTELYNKMRQLNAEWESRLEEATHRWNDERACIIAVAEETRVEL